MDSDNFLWPIPKNCGDDNITLKMNECCLDISSDLKPSARLFTRSSQCLECNFTLQKSILLPDQRTSFILNTDYPMELRIANDTEDVCERFFSFGSMGQYFWNISHGVCGEIKMKSDSESFWLNLGVLFSVLMCIAFGYVLYKCGFTTRFIRSVQRQVSFRELEADLGNPDARDQNKPYIQARTRRYSRIATIDVFRGMSIAIMIFVNYGGGGYSIFKHSPWDGLTIADVVFPWFIWLMGVSITLSLRSKLRTSVSRLKIFCQIMQRTMILILLGLILNSAQTGNSEITKGLDSVSGLRIPGILQRIGLTYCIVALTELLFIKPQRNEQFGPWNLCADIIDSAMQCVIALLFVVAHGLITFMLPVPGCPTGYLGPGGWHEHSKYENCTGGAAGYIDRFILTNSHLYQHPTCQKIYHNHLPYDPEGLLGTLTCVFCAFLGAHAGHIILCYENTSSRIRRWCIWGLSLGLIAGQLCNYVQNDGIIPVNKNLWSISYVCITSSLAFFIFSIFYWLIDYRRLYSGSPFLYAGMNAITIYVGHVVLKKYLPWHWKPFTETHGELLAMNLIATIIWLGIAYILYKRNIFIVL